MTPQEAETRIQVLCAHMDSARARGDRVAMQRIDAEIIELKKVTGARSISGEARITVPLPRGATGDQGGVEDFDSWKRTVGTSQPPG